MFNNTTSWPVDAVADEDEWQYFLPENTELPPTDQLYNNSGNPEGRILAPGSDGASSRTAVDTLPTPTDYPTDLYESVETERTTASPSTYATSTSAWPDVEVATTTPPEPSSLETDAFYEEATTTTEPPVDDPTTTLTSPEAFTIVAEPVRPHWQSSSDGGKRPRCHSAGYFLHPDDLDCRRFYRCLQLAPDADRTFAMFAYVCPQGRVFDPTVHSCNRKRDVFACDTIRVLEATRLERLRDAVGPSSRAIIETQTRRSTSMSKSTKTPRFDDDMFADLPADSPNGGDFICKEAGILRATSLCGKYYNCIPLDGGGYHLQEIYCDTLFFDAASGQCSLPPSDDPCFADYRNKMAHHGGGRAGNRVDDARGQARALLRSSPTLPHIGDDHNFAAEQSNRVDFTSPLTSIASDDESSDDDTVPTSLPQPTTVKIGAPLFRCPSQGYFRHPDDCSKFFLCVVNKQKRNVAKGGEFDIFQFMCLPREGEKWFFSERRSQCMAARQLPLEEECS